MYLLDTNIIIYLIKNKYPSLTEKILSMNPNEFAVSAVTIAELEYGASKSSDRIKNRNALLKFFMDFGTIIDFTAEDAEPYGVIRAYLEKQGTPIGAYDMQIAAQAMNRDYILVTNNMSKFSRIPYLKAESWIS